MTLLKTTNKKNVLKTEKKDTLPTKIEQKELLWTFSQKLYKSEYIFKQRTQV